MKLNVCRVTSVTLLASMFLSAVSLPVQPVIAYGSATEQSELTEMGTEKAETKTIGESAAMMGEEREQTESSTERTQRDTPAGQTEPEEPETERTEPGKIKADKEETGDTKASETATGRTEELQTHEAASDPKEEAETGKTDSAGQEEEPNAADTEEELPEPAEVKLELVPSDPAAECMDMQTLKVAASNPTDTDADLRLYFWDYSGTETDNVPKEELTEACETVRFPACGDVASFPVMMAGESGTVYEEFYLQEEWNDGVLSGRYLEVNLPAGCELQSDVSVMNDLAEKVVVSPVIFMEDTSLDFDRLILMWNNKPDRSMDEETDAGTGQGTEIPDGETADGVAEGEPESETGEDTPADKEDEQTEEDTSGTEAQTEQQTEPEAAEADLEGLKEEDFKSLRLLVMTKDGTIIRETDNVIGNYDDIYLLEYASAAKCMEAYGYYKGIAEAVEPDAYMEIASDAAGETGEKELAGEGNNPVTALSDLEGAVFPSDGAARVIALLDTGASASENVVGRVSLIDDVLEGHTHGNSMAAAMAGQNPDAKILSIRVMGNNGRGTVSAIVAGMEYAMEHGASIINLSLSSRKNQMNAVLEAEIQKAAAQGILVVGAAGNNSADVMDYMPGSVAEAYIIGACNKSGVRIATSNYGATVDYNVVAGTTSEAAAKFSGYVSRAGLDAVKVNEGILFAADYVAAAPEVPETGEKETEEDVYTEDELSDMAGEEEEGDYPGKGSSISQLVKIWTRDTDFDFAAFNPYSGDENVSVTCAGEIPEYGTAAGTEGPVEYICSLKGEENYQWFLYVTFEFTDDRSLATGGSSMLDTLMPEMVNQSRNEGYGGIVPEHMGETVPGRTYTALKDDTEFDIYGLLLDYNPETFKVNNLLDLGGFDAAVPGTYTVTYEMSYFLYPDYTWYVASKVNVVDRESLEAGIYLTSTESTLMFKKESDSHFSGYGDLVKLSSGNEHFTVRCIDPDYEVELTSSSAAVPADICTLAEREDGTKDLSIAVPDGISEAVIFSMYRPGYQSAKMFTGGGWVNGEEFNVEENGVDQLTEEEMEHLEDTVLGKVDENDEEYMEIAATWSTVESKNISSTVKTGAANTVNYSWVNGRMGACNYGLAQVVAKKSDISSWITEKGYNIDSSTLSDFTVNCASGHDYLGLWPNSSYNVTLKCYIQKNGDNYRLKITCSLYPGSDDHGNYQGFYGSKTYSSVNHGARLRVYKRFKDPAFMDENPNKYGYLKTTFAIYPESAYNKTTKMIDTTVEPESTIVLNDKEDDTVYGDSDILDPGVYYVMETRRISGCTANKDIYGPVVIEESDTGVVKLHEKVSNADYASMGSNNWIYNFPMYFNGKILTKTDDAGLPVADAVYKVEYSNAASADTFTTTKTWYFKTDANGILSYDHAHFVPSFTYKGKTYTSDSIIENAAKTVAMLPFGFVRIKEIMPPSDIYDVDNNTYMIELVAKKDAAGAYTIRKLAVKGTIPVSVDSKRYWKLNVEKTSMASEEVLGLNSYSLEGAAFGVFSDQACTKREQLYVDEKLETKVADNVLRTDASGKTPAYFLKAGTGSAIYYVKELTAPKGHQLVPEPVPVKVTMPDDALKLKTAPFKEGFSEPYDFMELDALAEKLSMHGNPVKGVVFKVCYYDDTTANAGQLKKTWYLESDEQGKVYLDENHLYTGDAKMKSDPFYMDSSSGKVILPIGGYVTLQEVKAPAQYVVDDSIKGFETKKQKVAVQRLYNDMVPCRIRLKKYDQTGTKPLEGVQFELKFVKAVEADTDLAKQYTALLKEGGTTTLTTDKNGEVRFENLDQGSYEITEVKTVAGQTLLKEKIKVDLPITMTKKEADAYGNVDFSSAKEDTGYSNKWFFYDCLYEITNDPQFHLPQTGGFGGWSYGYLGLALLLITGGIFLFRNKKKTVNRKLG